MHDRCYGLLEEKHCAIRTQSYDYRFTQDLVICGKGGFPFRLGVRLPKRWACLYLVRQSETEGCGGLFNLPGKGSPSSDSIFTSTAGS